MYTSYIIMALFLDIPHTKQYKKQHYSVVSHEYKKIEG